MKILYLITGLDIGGAEIQLLNVVSENIKRGYQCTVCSMTVPSTISSRFIELGVEVISLDMTPGRPSISGMIKYIATLRNQSPDIIHSHMVHANILSRFAKLIIKTPLINTAHSVNEGGIFIRMLYRMTKSIPDCFTHVSKDGFEYYIKERLAESSNFVHVNNGVTVDNDYTPKAKNDCLKFVHVARLEKVKNQLFLLEAISYLTFDYELTIVGDGTMRQQLESRAYELGIFNRVKFVGSVDNVSAFLKHADCFLLSSDFEGLPIAVLEAMSHSLPIISTNVGDLSKLVSNHVNGFLSNDFSSESYAVLLTEFSSLDSNSIDSMRKKSHQIVLNNYSIHSVCNVWENIYKRF
ncbi:glycosyltransferase [Vibrio splendidus]